MSAFAAPAFATDWPVMPNEFTHIEVSPHTTPQEPEPQGNLMLYTNERVNFRTGPGTTFFNMETLAIGTEVLFVAYHAENGSPEAWTEVFLKGVSGFIKSEFLTPVNPDEAATRRFTMFAVNFRTGPGTSFAPIELLPFGTEVGFVNFAVDSDNESWSNVTHKGKSGYIKTEFLSETKPVNPATLLRYTTSRVNFRSGPGTHFDAIEIISIGSEVSFVAFHADSDNELWSEVTFKGNTGFVKSEFLANSRPTVRASTANAPTVSSAENLDWSVVTGLLRHNMTLPIYDLRTGRSYNVIVISNGSHADVEPATQADTDVMRSTFGSWTWTPRPVLVTVGGRVFAGAMAGMPHAGSLIAGNGVNFCLHFRGSRVHNGNIKYQNELQSVVIQAFNAVR
jgi:uncharacterized protein YraI